MRGEGRRGGGAEKRGGGEERGGKEMCEKSREARVLER